MTVYSTGKSQRDRFQMVLEKGNIPLICEGNCKGVGSVTPERLARIVDPDDPEQFGVHEPCNTPMMVPETSGRRLDAGAFDDGEGDDGC